MSCLESGGIGIVTSNKKNIAFGCGTGVSSNTYYSVVIADATSYLTPGWHHFALTFDGYKTKGYIDGVNVATSSESSTRLPIYYNTNNKIFIGAEAAGNNTPSRKFVGNMSDVRIYATALDQDAITELYNLGNI